jgi:hypothetical protein
MKTVTRRDMLKAGLLAPVAAAAHGMGPISAVAMHAAQSEPALLPMSQTTGSAKPGAGREHLLLDFGWRFHFGIASDATKDFGFGGGRSGNFQKTGNFIVASSPAFDDSDWREVDLPHDWAIELPFVNDPALASKGFYPLGRNYPETSVGWFRRVFEIPAADAGKRITLEFDDAYRETMVVFMTVSQCGFNGYGYSCRKAFRDSEKASRVVRTLLKNSLGRFGTLLYRRAGSTQHSAMNNPPEPVAHIRTLETKGGAEVPVAVAQLKVGLAALRWSILRPVSHANIRPSPLLSSGPLRGARHRLR